MTDRVVEHPFGPLERMLAMRYLGAKREHGGLALISIVSVIGITLGVWALIATMSIMNGFRLELVSKILGFEPHVYVDTRGLPQSEAERIMTEIGARPGVTAIEPSLVETALVTAHGRSEGVQIRGIRPKDLQANTLIVDGMAKLAERDNRNVGTLQAFGEVGALSHDVVIGAGLADALGVGVGDTISVAQGVSGPQTIVGSTGGRRRSFEITGVFHVGNERYDRYSAFLPIESAKNFFSQDEGYPIIGVRLQNPDSANEFVAGLYKANLPYAQSWIDRNGSYITALIVERNIMRMILFIVVVIVALNIITGVLMLVKNKARDVAILRTIGATRAGVVRIFAMTGSILGFAGVTVGVILGVLFVIFIADIQHFIEAVVGIFSPGFEIFPKDIYMLDSIPAHLQWSEVVTVSIAAFIVTMIMSIIPSMWAARLNPVEALRFE